MRANTNFKYQNTQAANLERLVAFKESLANKGIKVQIGKNGTMVGVKMGLIRGQKADYSRDYFRVDGEYIKSKNSEKIIDTIAR